jgi:hypothetical protein
MVKVPVRIDQMSDWIPAETISDLQESRARDSDSGVDEHLAIATGQDGDVAARTLEDADVTAAIRGLLWAFWRPRHE